MSLQIQTKNYETFSQLRSSIEELRHIELQQQKEHCEIKSSLTEICSANKMAIQIRDNIWTKASDMHEKSKYKEEIREKLFHRIQKLQRDDTNNLEQIKHEEKDIDTFSELIAKTANSASFESLSFDKFLNNLLVRVQHVKESIQTQNERNKNISEEMNSESQNDQDLINTVHLLTKQYDAKKQVNSDLLEKMELDKKNHDETLNRVQAQNKDLEITEKKLVQIHDDIQQVDQETQIHVSKHQEEITILTEKERDVNKKIDENEKEWAIVTEYLKQKIDSYTSLQKELDNYQNSINLSQEQQTDYEKKISELEKKMEENQHLLATQNTLDTLSTEFQEQSDELHNRKENIQSLGQHVAGIKNQMEDLKNRKIKIKNIIKKQNHVTKTLLTIISEVDDLILVKDKMQHELQEYVSKCQDRKQILDSQVSVSDKLLNSEKKKVYDIKAKLFQYKGRITKINEIIVNFTGEKGKKSEILILENKTKAIQAQLSNVDNIQNDLDGKEIQIRKKMNELQGNYTEKIQSTKNEFRQEIIHLKAKFFNLSNTDDSVDENFQNQAQAILKEWKENFEVSHNKRKKELEDKMEKQHLEIESLDKKIQDAIKKKEELEAKLLEKSTKNKPKQPSLRKFSRRTKKITSSTQLNTSNTDNDANAPSSQRDQNASKAKKKSSTKRQLGTNEIPLSKKIRSSKLTRSTKKKNQVSQSRASKLLGIIPPPFIPSIDANVDSDDSAKSMDIFKLISQRRKSQSQKTSLGTKKKTSEKLSHSSKKQPTLNKRAIDINVQTDENGFSTNDDDFLFTEKWWITS